MARTKPLEEDEPINFARGVLDTLIAKHDPEAIREQGKDPAKVAAGLRGGAKGGQIRAQNLSSQDRRAIAKKAAKKRWEKRKKR
ncbi:MAG: histone H1 [Acidobacteriota bacterium]